VAILKAWLFEHFLHPYVSFCRCETMKVWSYIYISVFWKEQKLYSIETSD
jgi:hypothetical protein